MFSAIEQKLPTRKSSFPAECNVVENPKALRRKIYQVKISSFRDDDSLNKSLIGKSSKTKKAELS